MIFGGGRRKFLLHVFTLLNVASLLFAGAIMYETAKEIDNYYQNNACAIGPTDVCSQNAAQFAGAFLYTLGQITAIHALLAYVSDEGDNVKFNPTYY